MAERLLKLLVVVFCRIFHTFANLETTQVSYSVLPLSYCAGSAVYVSSTELLCRSPKSTTVETVSFSISLAHFSDPIELPDAVCDVIIFLLTTQGRNICYIFILWFKQCTFHFLIC